MRVLLPILMLAAALQAAPDPAKRYLSLKEDSGLYVGEGVVELKEFPASELKALEAARERARAALGNAIQVRIRSEISESSSNGKAGSSEELSAKSSSIADLILENVHDEDFLSFPKEDRVTVLAWISKEDYRRQLAGHQVPVYRHQNGFALGLGMRVPTCLTPLRDSTKNAPLAGLTFSPQMGDLVAYSLELGWRGWTLVAQSATRHLDYVAYHDGTHGEAVGYEGLTNNFDLLAFELGYDVTPWAWRLQPYLPLRAEAAQIGVGNRGSWVSGAAAGLGLRWWFTDALALEARGLYHQGLSQAVLSDGTANLRVTPGQDVTVDLNGTEYGLAVRWSGF
jgi:hypothetical protein